MDFSTFKPGQLACVKTLDAPVAVSAGAGSGKTFTLTRRIAWALLEGSAKDGGSFLNGIDEVLAITFTDKAAGEIKNRVKSTLRAEGMASESLKVDAAWISTIHGMCSRILHSHAVQLGIDPAFSVIDEARADELLDDAIEEALAGANEFTEPSGMDALFGEYSARAKDAFDANSVESMVRTLVRCAVASPQGFGCFAPALPPTPAGTLVRELFELISELRDSVQAFKPGKTRDAWLRDADAFIEQAEASFARGAIGSEELVRLFEACPYPSAAFGDKPFKERAKEAKGVCFALAQEAKHTLARPLLEQLMALANKVHEGYCRRKRELSAMDNDDLLIQTARALEENEALAREFADKFKLIMVDEFQDTDQLQVDMIERMAGPGACRLCTVGDAQQSIYRFRGADVSVYKRRLDAVRSTNPDGMITLPDNFRSHADILHFVDRIFEQPQVFGKEFMSLAPSRKEPVKKPFRGSRRIDVLLTTHPHSKGVGSDLARRIEAARIARRFAELREAGHSAGDMALLLGRMRNADVYAEALREAGFACVIAGGSVFASAPETRIMLRLAQVIANPRETAALFELLASEMFALSADDFIDLSTGEDRSRGVPRRRGLDEGFVALEQAEESGEKLSPQLGHAVKVVRGLAAKAGREPVWRIMSDAVRDSGWLSRLDARGAEGLSVAGNIFKAIRLVKSLEKDGARGPAEAAQALAAHLAAAKEAPGALSAKGGDFVRIMTVHASKGLEFPIVAVAEMERGGRRGGAGLTCETIDGATYVSLLSDKSLANRGGLWSNKVKVPPEYCALPDYADGATVGDVLDASSPLERACAVQEYARQQESEERRRLLYVALTRAKEALVFALTTTQRSSGYGSGADFGVYDDVRSALFGVEDFPEGDTMVDFGGTAPALVSRIDATEEHVRLFLGEAALPDGTASAGVADEAADALSGGCADAARTEAFSVPKLDDSGEGEIREEAPWRAMRVDVTSYSAMAQEDGGKRIAGAADEADPDASFWDALCEDLAADADKATDLGTAFHLLAQRIVDDAAGAAFEMPSDAAIERMARQCGLGLEVCGRLKEALRRWLASDVAESVGKCAVVRAELPFFVELEPCDAKPFYLEGSIDLFACDAQGRGTARIVDYKTGGSPSEGEEELRLKHELQAMCYAYACLIQGYDAIEATFVRVEQANPADPSQPQCVEYRFTGEDVGELKSRICQAYVRVRDE